MSSRQLQANAKPLGCGLATATWDASPSSSQAGLTGKFLLDQQVDKLVCQGPATTGIADAGKTYVFWNGVGHNSLRQLQSVQVVGVPVDLLGRTSTVDRHHIDRGLDLELFLKRWRVCLKTPANCDCVRLKGAGGGYRKLANSGASRRQAEANQCLRESALGIGEWDAAGHEFGCRYRADGTPASFSTLKL